MPRARREFSLAERAWRRTLRLIRRGTSSLRVLPDFLIVGAQKSGTSSLHAYLEEHPQLVAPPHRKELHFFGQDLRYHTPPRTLDPAPEECPQLVSAQDVFTWAKLGIVSATPLLTE